MKRKKLPTGTDSFVKIRKDRLYYVDKTGLIKDLVNLGGEVNLFTRPRRFGKSLNISMLKAFFEIGTDAALFEGLEIAKDKELCKEYLGQFPVISISLKEVTGNSFNKAVDMLRFIISEEAKNFSWLIDSSKLSKYDKIDLDRIFSNKFESEADICFSLRLLTRLLYTHYGKRVIVLIDEYDVPLDKAYSTGYYTDNEVKDILAYYGLGEFFDLFKEWYDGYHFGNLNMYCPWDVINQCAKLQISQDAQIESFWVNSSSNTIVRDILEHSTATTRNQIEALISGESIEKILVPELTYTDLDSKDNDIRQTYLWSVLFATGYLTEICHSKSKFHKLIIPNREILEIYESHVLSWIKVKAENNSVQMDKFCNLIKEGNAKEMELWLDSFMSNSISIRDTCSKKVMKENFYHGMLLGIIGTNDNWITISNHESGNGYTDILVRIPEDSIGCIFEVKYAENGAFAAACNEAMKQIVNRQYTTILKQDKIQIIHKYGIAFYKKTCKVIHELEENL